MLTPMIIKEKPHLTILDHLLAALRAPIISIASDLTKRTIKITSAMPAPINSKANLIGDPAPKSKVFIALATFATKDNINIIPRAR